MMNVATLLMAGLLLAADAPAPQQAPAGSGVPADAARHELLSGQVLLAGDALAKRRITSYEEMNEQAVLETTDGRLVPIVADWRGRAFLQDERLRNRRVDLVGLRPEGTPYLQVLMVFTFDDEGRRQLTDYWCDVCAIPIYEIKPCECCQDPVRLRFRPHPLPEWLSRPATESER